MEVTREAIERLSRYRAVLLRLKALGFFRVFSDNLADALEVSASQVRRDFATFGMRGVKRGGYQVAALLDRLSELLGSPDSLRAVVIGCGNIGTALLHTYGGTREGVSVVAGFDINPQVISPKAEVPICDMRELVAFIDAHRIRVAILAVPEEAVPGVMEQLRRSTVQGVLNFTRAQLRGDDRCLVQNIDLRMELEKLFCRIHLLRPEKAPAARPRSAGRGDAA